jgi:uncharacterized protein YndB with AHSA1/START domain
VHFTVTATIPASPRVIYDAWLDSRRHSAMTGARATASLKVGGRFNAWDGYASGRNLELKPGRRIVQSWRTTDFPADAPDSRVTLRLSRVPGGTKLILSHSGLLAESGYRQGWREFYFEPMKRYFAARDGGKGRTGVRRRSG